MKLSAFPLFGFAITLIGCEITDEYPTEPSAIVSVSSYDKVSDQYRLTAVLERFATESDFDLTDGTENYPKMGVVTNILLEKEEALRIWIIRGEQENSLAISFYPADGNSAWDHYFDNLVQKLEHDFPNRVQIRINEMNNP